MININSRNGIDFLLCKRKWGDSLNGNNKRKENWIEETLKNKIEIIFSFCYTLLIIYNGNIKMIEHANLQYVKPYRIVIKRITFLAFNYESNIYTKI